MEPYRLTRRPDGGLCVAVPYRGTALLAQPMFNKGSALCRVYENLSPGDGWSLDRSPGHHRDTESVLQTQAPSLHQTPPDSD
jgi:hypothetical protein